MSVKRTNALTFIFITVLIDIIGIGIIIPIIPRLIEQLIHGGLGEASKYNGWLTLAYALMQFICSPILGGLSDRFGRRPILLISLFGLGVDYLFSAWAPGIGWLFIGRIIAGMGGASYTTATAYIADISTPDKRAQNFGLIGVAFGVGFILGPVIGGVVGKLWGLRAPFITAAIFSLANCLYGYFVLPESLLKENRRPFSWKRSNPLGAFRNLKRYPVLSGVVVSFICIYLAGYSVQATWSFFTMLRFGWNEMWVGLSLGAVGVLIAVVQGGLIRVVIPWLGQIRSIFVGLILYSIGLILFAFAFKGWMMFAILVPYCLGGIAGPALQGLMSGQVPANEQGELQGALTAVMSATTIVGPFMMNYIFAYFVSDQAPIYFPGAAFFVGAIFMVLGIVFAYRTLQTQHLKIVAATAEDAAVIEQQH